MATSLQLIDDRYRIVQAIGQGGFGTVYEAVDTRLSKTVALKKLLLTGAEASQSFAREAKILNGLSHPALPAVTDTFLAADGAYLVMEYVPGETLQQKLEASSSPFRIEQVLDWAEALLDALHYLHSKGVYHRDIKPANIKVTPEGQLKLLDFGLAKHVDAVVGSTLAVASVRGFTVNYSAPEQIESRGTDQRSDIYSVGATMYALLSGDAPDSAITRSVAVGKAWPDPVWTLRQRNPIVPAGVDLVIQQAMALVPDERYQSALDFRTALRSLQAHGAVASMGVPTQVIANGAGVPASDATAAQALQPTEVLVAPQPRSRRRPIPRLLWVSVAAVIVLGAAGFLFLGGGLFADASPSEPAADVEAGAPIPAEPALSTPIPAADQALSALPPNVPTSPPDQANPDALRVTIDPGPFQPPLFDIPAQVSGRTLPNVDVEISVSGASSFRDSAKVRANARGVWVWDSDSERPPLAAGDYTIEARVGGSDVQQVVRSTPIQFAISPPAEVRAVGDAVTYAQPNPNVAYIATIKEGEALHVVAWSGEAVPEWYQVRQIGRRRLSWIRADGVEPSLTAAERRLLPQMP